jgi:hypothetical protein
MLPQNCRDFLGALGYFTRYPELATRSFSAKIPKEQQHLRINYGTAYRKSGSILPLSPMGKIHLGTGQYTAANGYDKGKSLPGAWDILSEQNKKPQGIYFTVNPGGQNKSDIIESPALFYEIDNLSKADQWLKLRELEAELGVTLTVVETKNSLHVYLILLLALTDLDLWEKYQQRLIQKMDSDISIHNPNRVMRLPDFDYWGWDDVNQVPVNYGPVELRQLGSPIDLALIESVLPAWETTRWSPPTEQPNLNYSGPSEFLDYFDMRNYAHLLPGYNAKGRQSWATAQCPNQGPGHSSSPSIDSLHINMSTGAPLCQAGCDGKDVVHASLAYAQTVGYPSLEQWARAKGIWREKSAVAMDLPSATAIAPPMTAFPDDLIPVKSVAVDLIDDDMDLPPDVLVAKPLIPIPEADNPELAYRHPKAKGDGKGTTLLGAAIRSLALSKDGQELVSQYVWVMNHNEFFDLDNQVKLKDAQLVKAYDSKIGFFKTASNWIELPQSTKLRKVSILDLLDAYDRQASDYGYAPGQPPLIPPKGKERFPRVNLWKPTPRGQVGATAEDAAPWLERVYNMMPGLAGDYFIQFLAHTVQHPEIKCDWAPLLYTEKRRSGREQLLAPIIALFNEVNQGAQIQCTQFDPRYTDSLIGKRLVILNEMKKPGSREFSNPDHWLKNLIGHTADPNKIYTRKGLGSVTMPDFTNFILVTNEQDAVTIMEDEGRYWPIETTWKGPEEDYAALGQFYAQGGFAKVWGYLHEVSLDGFSPWRPNLALSNFEQFCGATQEDARSQVLDLLESLHDPFITHHEVKENLPHVMEVQNGKTFRKLLANSPWRMSESTKDRVTLYNGRTQIKSHLVYQKQLSLTEARELFKGSHLK